MNIKSIAVFCGSKRGTNPVYMQHAAELGIILAKNNITLIYGGGSVGIMGALADAMMEHHGNVIGVIPEILLEWEQQHKGITELLVVDDMHTRKKKMYQLCDMALVLPGGYGTMDEFFEMITWNQLAIHNKKITILNSEGFYDPLKNQLSVMEENGFLYGSLSEKIKFIQSPAELLSVIRE